MTMLREKATENDTIKLTNQKTNRQDTERSDIIEEISLTSEPRFAYNEGPI